MDERNPADDDATVFGIAKAAAEAIVRKMGAAEEDVPMIGTIFGAGVTIVRSAFRS